MSRAPTDPPASADLPAQHRQLTAKDQDLHPFVDIGAEPLHHELGEPEDRFV
jgi:hypothetical protein